MGEFYAGRRVLVTGHTGFKGTWLCWLLSALGARVYGYALAPQGECLYMRAAPPLAGELLGDVRDREGLEYALSSFKPELVFHLAAHAFLDGSYEIPERIFETNVLGTVRLLDAVRKSGRHTPTVVVTSDKVYAQSLRGRPCREEDPPGAAEAYSTSKACQDLAAQCYQFSFPENPVAVARASNVVGGGDFHMDRLIPHLLDRFSRNEPAELRNPDFVRPWQYVLDVLWGYLTLGEALAEGRLTGRAVFNFGPSEDGFQTVRRTAEILAESFPGAVIRFGTPVASRETELLRLDSTKAREALGWRPVYSLREALGQTADFTKRCQAEPAASVCQDQVAAYLKRVGERAAQ